MKKISYYLSLFTVLCALVFTSCDDEQLEGEFFATPDGEEIVITDPTGGTCLDVSLALQDLLQAFNTATGDAIPQACENYRQGLENAIAACGDELGVFQATIDSLGDCTTIDPCVQAENATATALSAFNSAGPEEQQTACIAYEAALQNQIAACGDTDGSLQAIINDLDCDGECTAAMDATTVALEAFEAVDITDEEAFTAACNAYRLALQEQIIACGDADGSLQTIIDDLGDCTVPEDDGPVQMIVDETFINFNVAESPINGSTFNVTATDISTGDTFTFDLVLLQTGTNVMQNVELTLEGVVYTPIESAPMGEPVFVTVVTENDGVVIVGTFSGPMMDAEGNVITVSDGTINIEI